MKKSTQISPLRQRMLDDMVMRKMSKKTQKDYIRGVINFVKYFRLSPNQATADDLRDYQLHMAQRGDTPGMINYPIKIS
jgi:integrase/recombinase XerD